MIRYEVGFASERAEKEFFRILSKMPAKERTRILDWFDKLAMDPRPDGKSFKPLKGEMTFFQHLAQHRIREGHWRIFYDIDDAARRVILLAIRHRREAYD